MYIVNDNISSIISLDPYQAISGAKYDNKETISDFESIAKHPSNDNILIISREAESLSGKFYPSILFWDVSKKDFIGKRIVSDLPLSNEGKGLEGITTYRYNNINYVIGQLEEEGKLHLWQLNTNDSLTNHTTIALPEGVKFSDYADVTIYKNKICILSQEEKKFFVGDYDFIKQSISTSGTIYSFPAPYLRVEGIAFINDSTFATITDQGGKSKEEIKTSESIAIFNLK
jgi:hypothetical protein